MNEAGNQEHICAETVPTQLLRRPRCYRRRITDPRLRRLVDCYILNRGTQAEGKILEWISAAQMSGK